MKFRLIEDQRAAFPVRVLCDVMGVSPAGYYAWRSRPESTRKTENRALLTDIRRLSWRRRDDPVYEPQRKLLRQCPDGKLLWHDQN
jgi:putative transposase